MIAVNKGSGLLWGGRHTVYLPAAVTASSQTDPKGSFGTVLPCSKSELLRFSKESQESFSSSGKIHEMNSFSEI